MTGAPFNTPITPSRYTCVRAYQITLGYERFLPSLLSSVVQQVVNGRRWISVSVTMEVMKRSYLLLDGAGDNSVLFFLLIAEWNGVACWEGRRELLVRKKWKSFVRNEWYPTMELLVGVSIVANCCLLAMSFFVSLGKRNRCQKRNALHLSWLYCFLVGNCPVIVQRCLSVIDESKSEVWISIESCSFHLQVITICFFIE